MNNIYDNILYENLDEETRKYINKAIEIYKVLKDREIIVKKDYFSTSFDYKLEDLDKIILSLFLAGFITEGNLKIILGQFNGINVDAILRYLDLNIEDIKELQEDEYEKIYNEDFVFELLALEDDESKSYNIKKISPEIIFSWLSNPFMYKESYSSIMDQIFKNQNQIFIILSDNEYFKEPRLWAEKNGYIERRKKIFNFDDRGPFNFFNNFDKYKILIKHEGDKEENEQKDDAKPTYDDEKTWLILEGILKKFIGQEAAAEDLFYNVVNNQQLALRGDSLDGERSIIFFDGPSGTGKTAITREITDKLDIPFVATSITNYSQTGYVGSDLTDILKQLYEKSGKNLEKAQRGIVVLDEFDKITHKGAGGLEMKKAIQQQLLDFMGGGKYTISVGSSLLFSETIEFDTSHLTFICLGALTDLRDDKTKDDPNPLGFESETKKNDSDTYSITPQDLIDLGFERELVGRINTYIHTEDYSKEDLLRILKESEISPMIGFKRWIESKGKKLVIGEGVYEAIVDYAFDLNTGARSLQTVVNNIRTHFLKKVLREKEDTIYLDAETVVEICNKTINRRRKR